MLGLKFFSIISSVVNQSKARALAATELVVETVDLRQCEVSQVCMLEKKQVCYVISAAKADSTTFNKMHVFES